RGEERLVTILGARLAQRAVSVVGAEDVEAALAEEDDPACEAAAGVEDGLVARQRIEEDLQGRLVLAEIDVLPRRVVAPPDLARFDADVDGVVLEAHHSSPTATSTPPGRAVRSTRGRSPATTSDTTRAARGRRGRAGRDEPRGRGRE